MASAQPSAAPDMKAQGSAAERQAVYMYRTKIAALLACTFDVQFWTYDLLQTAEANQTVGHAVAALSAAYQHFILNGYKDHSRKQFVLDQYNKSLRSLRQCLSRGEPLSRSQQIVVLITSLLFYCVCAIQGLQSEACTHLRNSLALLHTWEFGASNGVDGSRSMRTATPINLLVNVYTRLDTQARTVINATGREYRSEWKSHVVSLDGWECGCQATITKAYTQLVRLYNRALQELGMLAKCESKADVFLQTLESYQQQLGSWHSAFGCLLKDESEVPSIRALDMQHYLAIATLELFSQASGREPTMRLQIACERMMHLAIQTIEASGFQQGRAAFNPAGNLLDVLYFVARYCQNPSIRRQAIHCLESYPIVEGLWKSSDAAKAAVVALGLKY